MLLSSCAEIAAGVILHLEGREMIGSDITVETPDEVPTEIPDIYIYGTLKDFFDRQGLSNGSLRIESLQHGTLIIPCDSVGSYETFIDVDDVYTLSYSASGYVSKHIQIDATGIPTVDAIGGFSMEIDVSLIPHKEGVDFSPLDGLIGKSRYVAERGTIEWDMEFTAEAQKRIDKMMKGY